MHIFLALTLALMTLFGGTPSPTPPIEPTATSTATAAPDYAAFSAADGTTDAELQAAANVIAARLRALNIDFNSVYPASSKSPSVLVALPRAELTDHLRDLLAQPGYLELVDVSTLAMSEQYIHQTIWTTGQAKRLGATMPDGALINPQTHKPFKTIIDGTQITNATVLSEQHSAGPVIQVNFDEIASKTMKNFTTTHIGKPLAIVIDGKIYSMPVIQAVFSDTAWIQGSFTEAGARELAAQLSSGPLPIPLQFSGFLSDLPGN